MRVFVAGASGAIGTRLVPQLIDQGNEVVGTSTSPENAERVRALGAEATVLDLLDARGVREAVLQAEPDAIVHQATALGDVKFSKNLDRAFAQTNRLRTEGIDALLAAAREAGVRRFVAQSFASLRYVREGGPVKTEDDPLDPEPLPAIRETSAAMNYLDQAVTEAGGIALRYGAFYGAYNDGLIEPVRKRQFPIVGSGGGVSSFIHLDDAAAATVTRARARRPGDLQHRRRRAGCGPRVAAGGGQGARSEAAPPLPRVARASVRGGCRGDDGNRGPRGLQREGQARARLDAALSELAAGLLRGLRAGACAPRDYVACSRASSRAPMSSAPGSRRTTSPRARWSWASTRSPRAALR